MHYLSALSGPNQCLGCFGTSDFESSLVGVQHFDTRLKGLAAASGLGGDVTPPLIFVETRLIPIDVIILSLQNMSALIDRTNRCLKRIFDGWTMCPSAPSSKFRNVGVFDDDLIC